MDAIRTRRWRAAVGHALKHPAEDLNNIIIDGRYMPGGKKTAHMG